MKTDNKEPQQDPTSPITGSIGQPTTPEVGQGVDAQLQTAGTTAHASEDALMGMNEGTVGKASGLYAVSSGECEEIASLEQTAKPEPSKTSKKASNTKQAEDDDSEEDDDSDEADSDDEDDDLEDELKSEFNSDLEEVAEAELAALMAETGGSLVQRLSTLKIKLAEFPNGAFPISEHSLYCENTWVLFINRYGTPKRVHFEGLTPPLIALKKALIYYVIPEFAPFGTIRSYNTTTWQASLFFLLERYIFKNNFLDGDAKSIEMINARLLNGALNEAKNTASSMRHYLSLFYLIRLWGSLSTQGLMPDGLTLKVDMRAVDTVERQKDLMQFSGSMGTWKPFSEEELGTLVTHALFWTRQVLPRLLTLVDYVKENKIDEQKKSAITRYKEDLEVEQQFNIVVEDRVIVAASKNEYSYRNGNNPKFKAFVYNWINSYSAAIDNVRNAVYVLLALVTGLRVSEMQALRFEDVTKDGDGNYVLRVTRFKTSEDPNFHGDVDYLPLPKYVGERIEDLKKLRSVYTMIGQGYLFQSCKGRRVINKPTGNMLHQVTRELEEATGIDRIHTHRFRKTIAQILINRSERNIDIIRHLFGHKSYSMTLQYIGRNPYLVRSVAQAIEQNYTAEFTELINAVTTSASSGPSADRLLERVRARPDAFQGARLQVTIFMYISNLLSAGEPLFIHRTAVGSYCLSTETYSSPNLPPCLAARQGAVTDALPDPTWCDVSCEHAVVVEKARVAMEDNVRFYANMLENASDILSERAKKMLRDKIAGNTSHLERLRTSPERIPVVQVKA